MGTKRLQILIYSNSVITSLESLGELKKNSNMASLPRSSVSEALGRVWASEYFKDPQKIPIGSQGFQSREPWLTLLLLGQKAGNFSLSQTES